jgi:GalNAc-alpha-(1->4)-GalNAc-alpha-(1->3)-diNAcBac-PP-undecaprenol alpha-1,4-N-acetyl-D-galactosaminyltransferase
MFAIPDMGMGGAERVISKLANLWIVQHRIVIVTLYEIPTDFYALNSVIKRISIGLRPKKWYQIIRFLRIAARLRKVFLKENPDYILSFLPKMNILSLVALVFRKKKLIICERNIINEPNVSARVNFFRKILYKRAYKITVQHEDIYKEFFQTFPTVKPGKVVITPNPVDAFDQETGIDISRLFSNYCADEKILISAGRFTEVKAHKDTLKMFAFLKTKIDNIRLIVCGDGKEFEECKALVNELKIQDSVYFAGVVQDISRYYAAAHVFVTTTYFEGFPNSLTEALSAGLPAVAFNAPSIPVFVRNGYNGFVIDNRNEKEMAGKVLEIVTNEALYNELSKNAVKIASEYSIEAISKIWMKKVLC